MDPVQIGVGPWVGPWPDDERYDPVLLAEGDRRNVVDRYRYWRLAAVVAELDTRRHAFHVAVENWQHDLNIGSVVRSANAFNAAGVHIVGARRFNRRGAMVTDRYLQLHHHQTFADLQRFAASSALTLVGVDNGPGAVPIESFEMPPACLLVFGQEGPGLSTAAYQACDVVLSIAQYGSTRSLNAGAAAAIAMHAWICQHAIAPT